jgi:hypothetical protein
MLLLAGNEGRGTTEPLRGRNALSGYSPGDLTWKGSWPTLHFLTRLGARSLERARSRQTTTPSNSLLARPSPSACCGRTARPAGPLSRITASDR